MCWAPPQQIFNPTQLLAKVQLAREAIDARLQELECEKNNEEEIRLLYDGLALIRQLKENLPHTEKVIVGTVKKSIAAMASRWLRTKASQRLAESGFRDMRFIQRETVLSEISKPSMRSSPWMRGAPQLGLSAIIWQRRFRTSFDVGFLPTGFRTLEIRLQ